MMFGRLGKQTNRSQQQSAFEPREAGAPPPRLSSTRQAQAQAQARARAEALAQQESHPPSQSQLQNQPSPSSQVVTLEQALAASSPHDDPSASVGPRSGLSNADAAAFSSSESFDTRPPAGPPPPQHQQPYRHQQQLSQSQHQHLQSPLPHSTQQDPRFQAYDSRAAVDGQDPAALPGSQPPPPLLIPGGAAVAAAAAHQGSPIAGDPSSPAVFDQRQQQRGTADFSSPDAAAGFVNRSQSHRYSTVEPLNQFQYQQGPQPHQPHQQGQQADHQQLPYRGQQPPQGYSVSSSSLDDLPSTAGYPPQGSAQYPEKRSARKLIRGIFGGGSHRTNPNNGVGNSSQDFAQQNFYENTGGPPRKLSKRSPQVSGNSLEQTIRPVSVDVEPPPEDDGSYQHSQTTGFHDIHSGTPTQQSFTTYSTSQNAVSNQSFDPRLAPGQLRTHHLQHSSESLSQISRESPETDSEPPSIHHISGQPSPAVNYASGSAQDLSQNPAVAAGHIDNLPRQQQTVMSPPAGSSGQPNSRRGQDAEKAALRAQGEAGMPPPNYRKNSSSGQGAPAMGGASGQGSGSYRSERSAGQFEGDPAAAGSQPSGESADSEKAFKDLLVKYKNVKRLYFEGKAQIENLSGQVEQLQNAVANQRITSSRTALDDNEYTTRFNRLNGAINNLSFNIRKDWRSLPNWLEDYVSAEALKTGKQEMTAVGRAVISRWLVEELFDRCFHPGLDAGLSSQLKEIELSIRGNSYTRHSNEEFEALTTSIVNWRMSTLDGLQKKLGSPSSEENKANMISKATSNLTALLFRYLDNPPPAGVEGSTSMIVELAVAIAANLPLESRDVAIRYPLPGDAVHPEFMDVEKTGLPVLEAQKAHDDGDSDSDSERESGGRKVLPKDSKIVRFAGFVTVEVRGRQVLMKAPVWTL